ncbi:MMPL family transporter [Microbacterium sp. NRRL B-14842]
MRGPKRRCGARGWAWWKRSPTPAASSRAPGIVLAAVFAGLGVLPLVTLGQLGLIVGVGVIVDTLVVRTVIVPALFALVGDRIWWPGRPASGRVADAR